jgi:hypothetical protein
VAQIQNSHKPEMDRCAPRFTSLGCDTDGRTYYALSASGPQRGKKERLPGEGERYALKRWGWFIAVFGKPGTTIQRGPDDDKDVVESRNESSSDRWWGFADVEEMRKLSAWLAYRAESDIATEGKKSTGSSTIASATSSTLTSRLPSPSETTAIPRSEGRPLSQSSKLSESRLDEDCDHEMDIDMDHDVNMTRPTASGLKALAKAVMEFANFVDWRLNQDHINTNRKGQDTIVTSEFYN